MFLIIYSPPPPPPTRVLVCIHTQDNSPLYVGQLSLSLISLDWTTRFGAAAALVGSLYRKYSERFEGQAICSSSTLRSLQCIVVMKLLPWGETWDRRSEVMVAPPAHIFSRRVHSFAFSVLLACDVGLHFFHTAVAAQVKTLYPSNRPVHRKDYFFTRLFPYFLMSRQMT